ncbi:ATP-binding protein [Sphingobacterium multivorum]|uniref:ATP-binding protein n=1 Tax=Sphingobacterium multivorum TaxID=28454 RepID=UPI002898939C|nr:ATP-binding protein [Sphingobacterium multivorum]
MITTELKRTIAQAIIENRKNFTSNARQAVALGIHDSILSRIVKGETEQVLSDPKWIGIARRLNVQLAGNIAWTTVKTKVYTHVYTQLEFCQNYSLSGILCDVAGIGKTYAAMEYCKEHKNAIYVDCSQYKSKQRFIRFIAKELGVEHTGRYADVYADLVFYINTIGIVLIVLDEVADLEYPAFLELKALWNATPSTCGWYMMGADGLAAKMDLNREHKKVGYAEIFDRFGAKYQRVSPQGLLDLTDFKRELIAQIGKANGIGDVQKLYAKTDGSLRRIVYEVQKLKIA